MYVGMAVVTWIVVGILWSALAVNLTFINSLLNSFSFMWAWGIYSLSDLSEGMYVWASIYAFFGAVLVLLFYSYCASEVEVSIEKYILRTAASGRKHDTIHTWAHPYNDMPASNHSIL